MQNQIDYYYYYYYYYDYYYYYYYYYYYNAVQFNKFLDMLVLIYFYLIHTSFRSKKKTTEIIYSNEVPGTYDNPNFPQVENSSSTL